MSLFLFFQYIVVPTQEVEMIRNQVLFPKDVSMLTNAMNTFPIVTEGNLSVRLGLKAQLRSELAPPAGHLIGAAPARHLFKGDKQHYYFSNKLFDLQI